MQQYKPFYAQLLEARKEAIPKPKKNSNFVPFFVSVNRENLSLCLEQKKEKQSVFLITPWTLNLSLKSHGFFFSKFIMEEIFYYVCWSTPLSIDSSLFGGSL